ncbi:Histone-lysine N-methyltransferase SETMAR [Oopsacas minuta]|uniref:Histone-lysine N-methyltransferase SETMAR n=1 Tax=Oopsacas minuta TaxID=111878 RepID=A0AAV7K3S8_9METZ|nr:Histone-lysine N-methyltransferase SETMAR [Oopsacas minuta]
MENSEDGKRYIIWFLWKQNKCGSEILYEKEKVYGSKCPGKSMVYEWIDRFNDGHSTVDDNPRPGRPKTCSNQENIKIISNILIKIDVPKLLSESQRIERVRVCRQLLRISKKEPRFFDRLVTGDETWLHFYEPKTSLQTSQWKRRHEATPIRPRAVASAVTINTEYYVQVLKKLREAIKSKRRGKLSSHVLLQHDNAPAHTSRRTLDEIQHLAFELLPYPPYSPDLAPSNYWLFSEMKRPLRGKRFSDFEHLRPAVNSWIQGTPEKFFTTGINKLPSNWKKCIEVKGEFIENYEQ